MDVAQVDSVNSNLTGNGISLVIPDLDKPYY